MKFYKATFNNETLELSIPRWAEYLKDKETVDNLGASAIRTRFVLQEERGFTNEQCLGLEDIPNHASQRTKKEDRSMVRASERVEYDLVNSFLRRGL